MKQIWKWVIAILLIGGLTFLIVKSIENEKRYFNKIELSSDNYVKNQTNYVYLDTVIKVGLEELKLEKIVVLIRELTVKSTEPNMDLKARIVAQPGLKNPSTFLIEIDKASKSDHIHSISHELIHLLHMNSGKLLNSEDGVYWNGELVNPVPPYEDREWEIQAVGLGKKLKNKIRTKLYN